MGFWEWFFHQPVISPVPRVIDFLHALAKIAPPAGEACYAFRNADGSCRGWVQFNLESPTALLLHRIWTLDTGKGNGKLMLETICQLADVHQVELVAKPLPFGPKPFYLSREQLRQWYERYGFVGPVSKMVRAPRGQANGGEGGDHLGAGPMR